MSDKNPLPWWALDNAAKIFPSTGSSHDSKVFRVFCELTEDVEPQALQGALDKTLEQFPMFRSVLKRGWFWYYLEGSALPAKVQPETLPPCWPIYPSARRSLLFRVLYFRKRVSLEVYHALTDGTGAMEFLRALACEYLLLRHPGAFPKPEPPEGASQWQSQDDSFQKYYEKHKGGRLAPEPAAYRIKGPRLPKNRMAVIEGSVPLQDALACARGMGATLTELMTALLLRAIHQGMRVRDQRKPVVVTVPVNLRSYFPSRSSRNFFAIFRVGYRFGSGEDSLEAVLARVKEQFQANLTQERMAAQMNSLCALEHSVPARLVPLPLKDLVLRAANFIAARGATATFSNVGKIAMPQGAERFIRKFGAVTCAGYVQACACSFGEGYTVNFASPFRSREVERVFFRQLVDLGMQVTVTANLLPGGEVERDAVL